ncbi:hypothetical protein SAMN05216360_102470 [Methylobacterium phyllostachyos]|uniref:Uncharacterized protein n=1 Tax=Methylobacterium phyllostachyos TaxID=582672 RepID=A0A1G9UBR1_9HYPH|nr:hypothetical protein [Methylobacterium phyllostachyos]SDM56975.1 hypothetical protein SAMN05216360_102470 [Methylobacterium phyllostachyos]
MDSELHATEVKCRDGETFSVHAHGPRLTLITAPDTDMTAASALAPYRRPSDPWDGLALYGGMPVEAVRSFCALHGGVAQIGRTAQTLLRALPSEADPPAEQAPAVETPIPDSRPSVADLVNAGTHDFLGRPLTPEQMQLDYLTPAVIEARRGLTEVEGALVLGLGHAEATPRLAALERRAEVASLSGSRLCLLDHSRYAAHPLRAEAIKLRKRLAEARKKALAEIAREA